jgi:excisionase family DNA binding protein
MSNDEYYGSRGDVAVSLRLAYRPGEVAKALGIGITRTRQYISEGRIQSVRIGKCILVTEDAIRVFLADAAAKGGV